jgi:hypothetical protein
MVTIREIMVWQLFELQSGFSELPGGLPGNRFAGKSGRTFPRRIFLSRGHHLPLY